MFPFREIEVYNSFLVDGKECEKVGIHKYLVLDELGEAESLKVADPNMMVELLEDEEDEDEYDDEFLCRHFFSTLLSLVRMAEESGQKSMKTKHLRALAEFYLRDEV
jgi:hypothetical protein